MTAHDLRALAAIGRGHYATQGTPRRIARYIAAGWVAAGRADRRGTTWALTAAGRAVLP